MSHSFIQLPPDSTGKKLHTVSNSVSGMSVHNQIVTLGDPNFPNQQQYVDNEGQAFIRYAEGAPIFDAFGKMKVSEEEHLNSFISYVDTLSQKGFVEHTGTFSEIEHDANKSGHIFTTDTASGNMARWTTNKRFFYNVGTGMYVLATVNIGDSGKENVVRKWGLYDNRDGLYFELDNTTLSVVIRNSSSGNVVETKISQENWNKDRLDGTGLSETTIDVTKVNIYWIDFQWLGAGRVRFGIVDDSGNRIICHEFRNANENSTMYMANSVLPYRVEQYNKDASLSISQMYFYNMGVMGDGNFNLPVIFKSAHMPDLIEIPSGMEIPIWTLRVKDTYLGKPNYQVILPASLALYTETNPVLFYILKNATLNNATWTYEFPNSIGQGDVTTTAVSGGTVVYSVICSPNFSQHIDLMDKFYYEMSNEYIKINANGISDTYTLMAKSFGTTSTKIYPLMSWRESVA